MSGTDYSFEGFDALERQLTQMIEQDFPEEFKALVIQIAYELQGRVKENTNVEYAEPVEYGHRTRGGKGFVKGKHMMAISLEEVSARLPAYLQEWLNDFISTHDL